jgi:phosphatidate cytidylyltransferase
VLKQRLLTAVTLGALIVWITLTLSTLWFGITLLMVVLLGAWEWSSILFRTGRFFFCACLTTLISAAWFLLDSPIFIELILITAGLFWCLVIAWLRHYAINLLPFPVLTWTLAGLLTLIPAWVALMSLHATSHFGPRYVLFLLLLIWIADSAAYFVGRRWGRTKLVPRISPGKTWEGVAGALTATLAVAGAGAVSLGIRRWETFMLICIITVLFSVTGDLLESMLKRQYHIKDSGHLLPGHGGILDRVDSLTAAAPIFLLSLHGFSF